MFKIPRYPILDSVVPPSPEEDLSNQQSLYRLENIVACAIVRNKRKCQMLSNVPKHLYKILWKAYLKDVFYKNKFAYEESQEILYDDLPELLYHWPYEEFILKEVMPNFPPRLKDFSYFCPSGVDDLIDTLIVKIAENLNNFHEIIVKTVARCCLVNNDGKFPGRHKKFCKISKINITGIYMFHFTETLDSWMMGDIKKPYLQKRNGKLEVSLDLIINFNCFNIIENVTNWIEHSYFDLSNVIDLRIGHLGLKGPCHTEDAIQLLKLFVNNGTFSIGLINTSLGRENWEVDVLSVIEKVFDNNASKANILQLHLHPFEVNISSMDFMQYFDNLVHLDLLLIDLHGRLDCLRYSLRGFLSLSLVSCSLKNLDLAQLTGSIHQSTLRELDLYGNKLSFDDNSNNLIMLCKNLTNVLCLNLSSCELGSWPSNGIVLLFDSFKIMPNLLELDLHCNIFSNYTFEVHIIILRENLSLRCLSLSLPEKFDPEDNLDLFKLFCSEITGKINNGRSQLLYVDICL